MKKLLLIAAVAVVLGATFLHLTAADSAVPVVPRPMEYAIVKWDGPDRVYYNLPDKFELVYLSKTGVTVPKEASAEEWCLAYAANKLAKEGWETYGLDSRRILLRRTAR